MSRKIVMASVVAALSGGFTLSADPKIKPDPVGPAPIVAQGDQAQPVRAQPNAAQPNQAAPGTRPAQGVPANAQWQWKNPDHALASCVAIGNQEEIELSQFASQKAQHDEVKKFAEMMIHDHQEFLQKLRNFAPEASGAGFLGATESQQARNATQPATPIQQTAGTQQAANNNQVQPAGGAPVAGNQGADGMRQGFRHLQIERELAQQCLTDAKQKLNSKADEEFDKCFMGAQVGMHMSMKSRLAVYQRHASAELGQVLAAGLQKTEQHLAKAEEIMKDLEHSQSGSTRTKTTTKSKTTDKD